MNMIDLAPDELVIDNFAGGGGASTGVEQALGRPVDIAINHDREALALHAANHPDTLHLCEDVWDVDIQATVAGRRVGVAWFSPDCTFHSKARGGKPIRDKEKKVRGLAWVALKWAGLVKPRTMFIENVEEFQLWGMVHREPRNRRDRERCKLCRKIFDGRPCGKHRGVTFKRWVTQLRNLGYEVEWRERRASSDGAPTIRKRLFIIARCDGKPIVWPEPTHGKGLLPYRTAAECIDFSLPCPSIFMKGLDAKKLRIIRPLADKTLARIAKGVKKYVLESRKPFIVSLTHHGADRVYDTERPINTVTGAHRGENALVVPTLIQTGYGEREGQSPRVPGIDKPLGTVVASGGKHAEVAAFLARHNGTKRPGGERGQAITEPLSTLDTENRLSEVAVFLERQFGASVGSGAGDPVGTITSGGGGKTALITAFLAQHNTQRGDGVNPGRQVDHPIATVTASGGQIQLVEAQIIPIIAQHQGGDQPRAGKSANEPISTITQRATQIPLVTSHVMKMKGTNIGHGMDEPLHTLAAHGQHFAEVRVFLKKYLGEDVEPIITINGETYIIVDIGMRMLTPRELFTAQGFPMDYIIDRGRDVCASQSSIAGAEWIKLTKTAQIRMCGNSVSPYSARALVRAQFIPSEEERLAA